MYLSPIDAIPHSSPPLTNLLQDLCSPTGAPQDWPGQPKIGVSYDHTIDMSANARAAIEKPNCPPIPCSVAQVETSGAQPANGQRLELMSDVEDAQGLTVEAFLGIDRCAGEFVDELACAGSPMRLPPR